MNNRWILFGAAIAALIACSNKLEQLSDADLQDKAYECNRALDLSPGAAISCDNYRRECDRRREQGRFVC